MKGEEAVELFALIKQENLLPGKVEELVPLSFIGQAAVSFYRQKIKLMDQLKMTEDQRRATLRDGQDAGEMLLDIEARIGELLPDIGDNLKTYPRKKGKTVKPVGVDTTVGSELSERRKRDAKTIKKNPEIVAKIKAQARENEERIKSKDPLDHRGKKIPGQAPSGQPPKHERLGIL
jgi:hypothetical protein